MQLAEGRIETVAQTGEDEESSSWGFMPGDRIAPDLFAWEVLGIGRRHETWLAWCASRWSAVVVKLPRQDRLSDGTLRALVRESDSAGSLFHPSIVRLLESRLEEGEPLPFIMYEYVEGPTLDVVIDDDGPLAPSDVIRLGMQIASALHYLHARGIVHLDVKPGNIAIREGRAVLLDFDIALPLGDVSPRTKPRGTPCYMAPEQVACLPAAPSMDLWALGGVLYEAATGEVPFEVEGEGSDRVYPQMNQDPVRPTARNPEIPGRLEDVIETLLGRDPGARPASAMEALRLLASSLPEEEESLWPTWADGFGPGALRP